MRAIFVSYRRDDSEGEAGRLFDDLVAIFGENSVFMDVAAIEAGRDFRKVIDESVATCGVLLAVIGKGWIDAKNEAGQRRLDDPSDFVRLETASALKRDIAVIPVLVHDARMPRPEELPDDLKDLAYRNGVALTHPRWSSDLQLLVKALRPHVETPENVGGAAARQSTVRVPNQTKVSEVGKKPVGTILALVAAAVVAVAAVTYMVMPKQVTAPVPLPSLVEIPPLVGESLDDARRTLADSQLHVGAIERKPKAGVARDTVLQEFPIAGERIKSGSKVDLMVSDVIESAPAEAARGGSRGKASAATQSEKVPASSNVPQTQPPTEQARSDHPPTTPAASQPKAVQEATETPAEVVKPGDQVANINGNWLDPATGIAYQVWQTGTTFTVTGSWPGGMSKGAGTIMGLKIESSYTNFYADGRSTGRCTGKISADGSMIRGTCHDSVRGETPTTLTR